MKQIGIIGSGLGGLSAACVLAARGHEVTLFERNEWLGGKAAQLTGEGFRFDMGPTIVTLPSVLRRIFTEAGARMEDYLGLVRLDPQWRCFFDDGSTLDLAQDPAVMAETLDAFAPGTNSGQRYREFIDYSERLNGISQRHFFYKPIGGLLDMFEWKASFDPKMLGDVLAMRMGRSVASTVRAFTPDPRVAQMIDHFTQYVGSSPYGSPAILCGIAHMQTDEGIWYPLGGTRAVPEALVKLATELGVQFHTGVKIEKILSRGGVVTGVLTDWGEEIALDAVVSNCDSVRTHRELTNVSVRAAFERRRKYEPACSGVVLYSGAEQSATSISRITTLFSAAIRTRSSIGFTKKASPRPIRPATSRRRAAPNRARRRSVAKRSTFWFTRPTCAPTTIGKKCCLSTAG
jgi:phytoene desaturase